MNLGPIELAAVPLLLLLVAFLLYRAQRISEVDLQRWADANGVSISSAGARVRRYLAWSRRCRALGFLGAIGLSATLAGGLGPLEAAIFGFVGYLLGALLAELVINRPARASGVALLKPRIVTEYAPRYALNGLRGASLCFLVLEGAYSLTPLGARWAESATAPVPDATTARFVASTLAVALLVAIVEGMLRLIVARRQPASSPENKAVDDAMRAASARAVTGGGLALLCLAIAGEALGFQSLEGVAGLIARMLGAAAIVAALVVWFALSKPRGNRLAARADALSV